MSANEAAAEATLRSAIDLVKSGSAVEPGLAQAVLEAAADMSARLPRTQHPLGFLHLDLSSLTTGGSARLHLWTQEFLAKADPLGRLHDHTWELRSSVLVGTLHDHVLRPVPDKHGDYIAHVVHYGAEQNRIESLSGSWRLEQLQTRTVRQGQYYQLAPRLVHRTEVPVLPTATLVVPLEHGGPGPKVFAPSELRSAEAAPRTPVPVAIAKSALLAAARSIGGN